MTTLDTIRTLADALSLASGPDTITVALVPYRGTGERSTKRGWRVAVLCDRERAVYTGFEPVQRCGKTDEAALEALAAELRSRVTVVLRDAEGSAAHNRRMAAQHAEQANALDARAARLRAVLEETR